MTKLHPTVHPGTRNRPQRVALVAALLASSTLLGACAPLLVGGAVVGGGLVAIDRRTSGSQLDDEGIELRSRGLIREAIGADRGHVVVTSYNRVAMLTGQVDTEADRQAAARAVGQMPNVRSVIDELTVQPPSSLSRRSADTLLTARVKTALTSAGLQSNAIKVVTERDVVYLMGRVTPREADKAVEVTRAISGVEKVVRAFEPMSEEELGDLRKDTLAR